MTRAGEKLYADNREPTPKLPGWFWQSLIVAGIVLLTWDIV